MKTFLVIEDDPNDAFLIRRAFASMQRCQARVCRNLSEAKAYLDGAGIYACRDAHPFPHGVICDLRLGSESAADFLSWIKGSDGLHVLPVVVLSGGGTPEEHLHAENCGAEKVLTKPPNYEQLCDLLRGLAASLRPSSTSHS